MPAFFLFLLNIAYADLPQVLLRTSFFFGTIRSFLLEIRSAFPPICSAFVRFVLLWHDSFIFARVSFGFPPSSFIFAHFVRLLPDSFIFVTFHSFLLEIRSAFPQFVRLLPDSFIFARLVRLFPPFVHLCPLFYLSHLPVSFLSLRCECNCTAFHVKPFTCG